MWKWTKRMISVAEAERQLKEAKREELRRRAEERREQARRSQELRQLALQAEFRRLAVIARLKPFIAAGVTVDFDPKGEGTITLAKGENVLVISASGDDATTLIILGVY